MNSLAIDENATERLPIVVTGRCVEKLLDVPKLENSSGLQQATAVFSALEDWELTDKIQALCCDTTASNTGRLNGACILLEQKLGRELIYFPCRHHIYELVLKGVFEAKLPQITTNANVPFFKNFKNHWFDFDLTIFESGMKSNRCKNILGDIKREIISFALNKLEEGQIRDDYKELLELTILFLSENDCNITKIRPPGALHQARWMARAIYCLKIFLLRSQYSMLPEEIIALEDVCVFIIKFYIKAWFECPTAYKAPNLDLNFIKQLKAYENVDKVISAVALKKICGHLWYLVEETSSLSFFDETLSIAIKKEMVKSLNNEESNICKRIIVQPNEMDCFTRKFD